jgi:hypothetical protein
VGATIPKKETPPGRGAGAWWGWPSLPPVAGRLLRTRLVGWSRPLVPWFPDSAARGSGSGRRVTLRQPAQLAADRLPQRTLYRRRNWPPIRKIARYQTIPQGPKNRPRASISLWKCGKLTKSVENSTNLSISAKKD